MADKSDKVKVQAELDLDTQKALRELRKVVEEAGKLFKGSVESHLTRSSRLVGSDFAASFARITSSMQSSSNLNFVKNVVSPKNLEIIKQTTKEIEKQNKIKQKVFEDNALELPRLKKILDARKAEAELLKQKLNLQKEVAKVVAKTNDEEVKRAKNIANQRENAKLKIEEELERQLSKGLKGLVHVLTDKKFGGTFRERELRVRRSGGYEKLGQEYVKRVSNQLEWKLANVPGAVAGFTWDKIKEGTQLTSRYEDALAKTQAIAGSTAGTLDSLANAVFKVGSNSRYTNDELINTTTILAQAGYSAKEIEDLLGTVSRLASATGTDARTSVDLLTSSMSLWNAQTTDAAKMTDVLTIAVNNTKAEINSIQKGMQYAGAAASQMGLSFEETVAAMSAVTNAGLKTRSIMGTGLRAMLTELTDPAKKLQKELSLVGLTVDDVNVRTLGLSGVMEKLAKAGFGAENAFRGMDRQAASFYLALKSQLDLYDNLNDAMAQRGAAQAAEEKRMDTMLAQLTRFSNVSKELIAFLGTPFSVAIKKVLMEASDFLEIIAKIKRELGFDKDLETQLEEASAESSSSTQKISSLADEIERIARNSKVLSNDSDEIRRIHISLAERFDATGKSVRGLSKDYKDLIDYLKELMDISKEEKKEAAEKAKSSAANVKRKTSLWFEKSVWMKKLGAMRDSDNLDFLKSISGFTSGNFGEYLNSLSKRELESLVYNFTTNRPEKDKTVVLSNLRKLLADASEFERVSAEVEKYSSGESSDLLKSYGYFGERMANYGNFKSGLKSKSAVERVSAYLAELENARNQADELKFLEGSEEYKRKVEETASTYIQQVLSSLNDTLSEVSKETEKTLKSANAEAQQKAVKDYDDLIDSVIKSLSGENSVVSKIINLASNEKTLPPETLDKLKEDLDRVNKTLTDAVAKRLDDEVKRSILKLKPEDVAFNKKIKKIKDSADQVWMSQGEQLDQRKSGLEEQQLEILLDTVSTEGEISRIRELRDTEYSRLSDKEFESKLKTLEDELKKLKLDSEQNKLDLEKSEREKRRYYIEESDALRNLRQNRLSSKVSVESASVEYDAYGNPSLSTGAAIGNLLSQANVLKNDRGRIEYNWRTFKHSGLYKDTDLEFLRAREDYWKALDENTKAIMENNLRLVKEEEQQNRETEGLASANQALVDFLRQISTESASYALTLEGLNSISNGLKTAFKEIAVNGAKASDAFKTLTKSVLESMANKAIDKGTDYLMKALTVGVDLSAKKIKANLPSSSGATGGFVSYGGIKKFAAGGIAGRDSVPALLMPGEYVMKKSAVDMIGKETLDAMNNAATRMHESDKSGSGRIQSKPSKPVVTNVYVVNDPKEAGMTPNDVLVTIGRDILQGGQTRQLIQQVVQGQY